MRRLIVVAALLGLSACSLSAEETKPKPPRPVALVSVSCERELVALEEDVAGALEPVEAQQKEVADRRDALDKPLRRLQKAIRALKTAERPLRAFNADHPEQFLPPGLYEYWRGLRDEYQSAFAGYRRRFEDARPVRREYNAAVREARALWRNVRRREKAYDEKLDDCLGPAPRIARAERNRIRRLEKLLGDISAEAAGRPVTLHCETAAEWRATEAAARVEGHLLGYVFHGARAVHLAPELCYALHRVRFLGAEPDLSCLARSRDADAPLCAPRASQLIRSALTLAHEALHVAGETNEKRAQCFGLQRTALVAQRLGVQPSASDQLAWYAWHFSEAPKSYASRECRDGGALDENPGSSSFP